MCDVHSSMHIYRDVYYPQLIRLTVSFLSQIGLCTDEDYGTYATQTASAVIGDGASGNRNIQSNIAGVNTATDATTPSLRKVDLDWEKEGMSWNADGSLVFKLDETITT